MRDARAQRPPGARAITWGLVAVIVGLVLFGISGLIGLVSGHPFGHTALLALPLALLIGGLTAITTGSVQRLIG